MSSRVVHLHIDRIVVDGLPPAAQQRFLRALESELTGLAESGLAESSQGAAGTISKRRISSLQAGQMRAGASAERAAGQVVQAVRQRLSAPRAHGDSRPVSGEHTHSSMEGKGRG